MTFQSDTQLEVLQNMNDLLTNKDSFYLTFTSNKSVINQRFAIPIQLNPNRKYEAALHNFTTSNYQINIDETNNRFYYKWDNQDFEISFEKGAYEVVDISTEILRVMIERKQWGSTTDEKEAPFRISLNLNVFKSIIEIKNDKLKIDFTKDKTFRGLLGFDSKVLSKGYNISDNTVQITSASLILIHCSIISGGYHNGEKSNILYSLPAYRVPIGYKINVEVPERMYLPVNTSVISEITFKITDDNYKILDFKDEQVALSIHIKQI